VPANSSLADHNLDPAASSPPNFNAKNTATQNTPNTITTQNRCEGDRALHFPSSSSQYEIGESLSSHKQQRPSFIIRRLSLSSNRRSSSVICRTVSDLHPGSFCDEDDDIVVIPEQFQRGIEMLRVTRKKVTKCVCWIDPVSACVGWDSKSSSKRSTSRTKTNLIIIYIDDIKMLHSATKIHHYREQFHISFSHESTWFIIVYNSASKLKTLHLIASIVEKHDLWNKILKNLRRYRKEVTGELAFLMALERKHNP